MLTLLMVISVVGFWFSSTAVWAMVSTMSQPRTPARTRYRCSPDKAHRRRLVSGYHLGAVTGSIHLIHQFLRYRLFSRQRFHHVEHAGARAGGVHAHAQRPGVMVQAVRCLHRVAAALPDGRALAVCALPGFHHELILHPAYGKAVVVALLHKADKVIAACGAFSGKSTARKTPAEVSNTATVSPAAGWVNCSSADSTAGRLMLWTLLPFSCGRSVQPVSSSTAARRLPRIFSTYSRSLFHILYCTLHGAAQKIQPVVYHILRSSARGKCVKIYPMISVRKSILTNCTKHATL